MVLQLSPKTRSLATPYLHHLFFFFSSSSDTPPSPSPPPSSPSTSTTSQSSISSYFSDVKASLKQPSSSQQPRKPSASQASFVLSSPKPSKVVIKKKKKKKKQHNMISESGDPDAIHESLRTMKSTNAEKKKYESYDELGEKLRKMRPYGVKEGESWFSLGELNERLMKLREIDKEAERMRLFADLRKDLVKLGPDSDESLQVWRRSYLQDFKRLSLKERIFENALKYWREIDKTQAESGEHLIEKLNDRLNLRRKEAETRMHLIEKFYFSPKVTLPFGELNERLMKLREIDKEAESRESRALFADLRNSLVKMGHDSEEKTPKA